MISIPFSGSKKYSYKQVKQIAEENGYDTVIEPFGGSAVLSVNLYNDGLVEKAVINDFDGIFDIYEEYLDLKDWVNEECFNHGLLRSCHYISKGKTVYKLEDRDRNTVEVLSKSRVLQGEQREFIQSLFKQIPEKYWKLFSYGGNYCYSAVSSHEVIKLSDWAQFDSYIWTDKQRAYLEVVKECTLDSLDYKDFLEKYKDEITERTLIILDPPYHNTYQKQYKEQFDDERTQEMIDLVKSFGCDFVFFNADVENVKRWLDGLDYTLEITGNGVSSANRKRRDVMAFVRNRNDKSNN